MTSRTPFPCRVSGWTCEDVRDILNEFREMLEDAGTAGDRGGQAAATTTTEARKWEKIQAIVQRQVEAGETLLTVAWSDATILTEMCVLGDMEQLLQPPPHLIRERWLPQSSPPRAWAKQLRKWHSVMQTLLSKLPELVAQCAPADDEHDVLQGGGGAAMGGGITGFTLPYLHVSLDTTPLEGGSRSSSSNGKRPLPEWKLEERPLLMPTPGMSEEELYKRCYGPMSISEAETAAMLRKAQIHPSLKAEFLASVRSGHQDLREACSSGIFSDADEKDNLQFQGGGCGMCASSPSRPGSSTTTTPKPAAWPPVSLASHAARLEAVSGGQRASPQIPSQKKMTPILQRLRRMSPAARAALFQKQPKFAALWKQVQAPLQERTQQELRRVQLQQPLSAVSLNRIPTGRELKERKAAYDAMTPQQRDLKAAQLDAILRNKPKLVTTNSETPDEDGRNESLAEVSMVLGIQREMLLRLRAMERQIQSAVDQHDSDEGWVGDADGIWDGIKRIGKAAVYVGLRGILFFLQKGFSLMMMIARNPRTTKAIVLLVKQILRALCKYISYKMGNYTISDGHSVLDDTGTAIGLAMEHFKSQLPNLVEDLMSGVAGMFGFEGVWKRARPMLNLLTGSSVPQGMEKMGWVGTVVSIIMDVLAAADYDVMEAIFGAHPYTGRVASFKERVNDLKEAFNTATEIYDTIRDAWMNVTKSKCFNMALTPAEYKNITGEEVDYKLPRATEPLRQSSGYFATDGRLNWIRQYQFAVAEAPTWKERRQIYNQFGETVLDWVQRSLKKVFSSTNTSWIEDLHVMQRYVEQEGEHLRKKSDGKTVGADIRVPEFPNMRTEGPDALNQALGMTTMVVNGTPNQVKGGDVPHFFKNEQFAYYPLDVSDKEVNGKQPWHPIPLQAGPFTTIGLAELKKLWRRTQDLLEAQDPKGENVKVRWEVYARLLQDLAIIKPRIEDVRKHYDNHRLLQEFTTQVDAMTNAVKELMKFVLMYDRLLLIKLKRMAFMQRHGRLPKDDENGGEYNTALEGSDIDAKPLPTPVYNIPEEIMTKVQFQGHVNPEDPFYNGTSYVIYENLVGAQQTSELYQEMSWFKKLKNAFKDVKKIDDGLRKIVDNMTKKSRNLWSREHDASSINTVRFRGVELWEQFTQQTAPTLRVGADAVDVSGPGASWAQSTEENTAPKDEASSPPTSTNDSGGILSYLNPVSYFSGGASSIVLSPATTSWIQQYHEQVQLQGGGGHDLPRCWVSDVGVPLGIW